MISRGEGSLPSSTASSSGSLPPPHGADLQDYILGFSRQSSDAFSYAETHIGRLVRTLQLTPQGTAADAILEMGAYMQMTPALQTKLGYGEVRGCYLGSLGHTDYKETSSISGEKFVCAIDLFNAETDEFPYANGHFRTVLCCELLEHLAEDPMHMMAELNRVIKLNGYLVLSTPNACALRSIAAVLSGAHPGLFTQYTARVGGNQREPRHAREYTPLEIRRLLDAAGFTVEHLETGWYPAMRPVEHDWVKSILHERRFPTDLRDDVIYVVGRKSQELQDRYPSWLYI